VAIEKLWADCRSCGRSTLHGVLAQHEKESDPEIWHEKDTWQLISCLGCTTVGFRHRHDEFELAWEDHDGEIHHEFEISVYPRGIKNHKKLDLQELPNLIHRIYQQTLSAYSEKALILAGIGLRATVEAVCNQLKISGSSLEKRIDQLHKGGYVSNGDKKRLHAIRFLGNDAAHDIKEPKESELRIALAIIEHLLNSVFILESKAKALETVIETYEEFLPAVAMCAKQHSGDQAVSLPTLLDRKRRLIGQNLDIFESKLKADILSGEIPYLTLTQEQQVGGKSVQFYLVGDTSDIKYFDDDIPF
jgi:hypothetical protein